MTHTVACIQMGALGTWGENVNHAVALTEKTDADLIVLPELFAHCRNFKAGERIPGRTTEIFGRLAREKGCYILMGSILEEGDNNQKFNTSVLINRRGRIVAKYRKIHLFSCNSKEKSSLVAGEDVVTIPTELGTIGFSICYDLRFPELYRALIKKGAEIIVCPAAWPYPRVDHWITLNKARAIEAQCYFIGCNQVGTPTPTTTLAGCSMITDPWGEVIAAAGHTEEIVGAVTDLTLVRKTRDEYTFLKDFVEL
ncbi:MAG: nitrilase-related carbon-nitrogen hydrolase [Halobacteriota archaeon]